MSDSAVDPVSLVALEEAIAAAGGQTALGRAIGKTQGHVSKWVLRKRCAPECVLAIEAATGVSRHRLRADVFGAEPEPGDRAPDAQAGAAA